MIVAITGATGFVGRRLVKRHLSLGNQVRFLTTKPESLNAFAGARGFCGRIEQDTELLKAFLQNADVVYHLAAEIRNPRLMHQVNVNGTRNLIEASRDRIGQWVQLSSTGVYGAQGKINVNENVALNPRNIYETTKAESDKILERYAHDVNLPTVILRPSNIYGPEMPNQSLFQLISIIQRQLFFFVGSRPALVNYVHVENVIDALMLAGHSPGFGVPKYIVSQSCDIEQLVGYICSSLQIDPPKTRLPEWPVRLIAKLSGLVPGSPLKESRIDAITGEVLYSQEKIECELGYQSRISLEQGFTELVQSWKRANLVI